jgi:hypothetical protein
MSHSSVLRGNEWQWDLVALVVQSTKEVSHTLSAEEQMQLLGWCSFCPIIPGPSLQQRPFSGSPVHPCFQSLPAGTARAATKSELFNC